MHNTSAMVAVLGEPCAIPPLNSNSNLKFIGGSKDFSVKKLFLFKIINEHASAYQGRAVSRTVCYRGGC
jgi:hypothetical protein